MKFFLLMFFIVFQFTALPFIHMVSNNKPATFHVTGTVIYKSN